MANLAQQILATPALAGGLRAAVAALPRWTLPDAPFGQGTLEDELAWIALGLVVDADARDDFSAVLGPEELAAVVAAGAALAPQQVAWIRGRVQLRAAHPRLDDLRADEHAATPATPGPVIAASPRGLVKARFVAGAYDSDLDAELQRAGVDVIAISNPSVDELEHLDESRGYYLTTKWIRYVTRSRSEAEFLTGLEPKHRSRMRNMLGRSAAFPPIVGPLTEPDYTEWYQIYRDEVLTKPGAEESFAADHATAERAAGRLGLWHGVFFREPETRTFAGGAIMGDFVERGIFSISGAAYRHDFKQYALSLRTYVAAHALALERGWSLLSYGCDDNFYGYDQSIGLLGYKLSLGVTPFPESQYELIKILDPSKIATVANHEGRRPGYFFFSVRARSPLWQRVRAARASGATPNGHQLLGGHYFSSQCLRSDDNLVGNHFYGDDVQLRSPLGITVVRRPMAR